MLQTNPVHKLLAVNAKVIAEQAAKRKADRAKDRLRKRVWTVQEKLLVIESVRDNYTGSSKRFLGTLARAFASLSEPKVATILSKAALCDDGIEGFWLDMLNYGVDGRRETIRRTLVKASVRPSWPIALNSLFRSGQWTTSVLHRVFPGFAEKLF